MKFSARVQVLFLLGTLQTLVSATASTQADSIASLVERAIETVPSTQTVDKRTFIPIAGTAVDPANNLVNAAGGVLNNLVNTAGGVLGGVVGSPLGGPNVYADANAYPGGNAYANANANININANPYVGGPGSSYTTYETQTYGDGPDCKKRFVKVRKAQIAEEVESA